MSNKSKFCKALLKRYRAEARYLNNNTNPADLAVYQFDKDYSIQYKTIEYFTTATYKGFLFCWNMPERSALTEQDKKDLIQGFIDTSNQAFNKKKAQENNVWY